MGKDDLLGHPLVLGVEEGDLLLPLLPIPIRFIKLRKRRFKSYSNCGFYSDIQNWMLLKEFMDLKILTKYENSIKKNLGY